MRYLGWLLMLTAAPFGASAGERKLETSVAIDAPRAYVWQLWTTSEGAQKFGPQKADIELTPGGKYEWYFNAAAAPGERGSEDCKVLSYVAPEMLAFSWNAPPSIPDIRNRGEKTQVVVEFDAPASDKTVVRLTQHGFGTGESWEKYVAYFERAWPHVLSSLKEHCESAEGRKAAAALGVPGVRERKTWVDGAVTVEATYGTVSTDGTPVPHERITGETPVPQVPKVPQIQQKMQSFSMTVPAPIEEVWAAIATTDGFRKYVGLATAEIELRPDGRYAIWPDAPNRVLAYLPGRVLSVSGSAPPKFPNVRKGGTWSAYWLEPAGKTETKLRLSVVGWRSGEPEWDEAFEYFLKNNPVFLNALRDKLAKSQASAKPPGAMLRHEGIVDAPVEEVWRAMTTKEGLESWMVAMASIDLRIGGIMLTKYTAEGTLGDDDTIENTILSYEPNRMFSIRATKPPKNFPFKTAIEKMWTVVYFEPVDGGKTRVTCVGMGYEDDAESQKLRQHFDAGNAWTIKKLQERFAKAATATK